MFWCVHFLSRPSGIKVSLTSGVCLGCCGFVLKMPPPVVLVNDTPCGFARHLDLREPTVGSQLWGDCMYGGPEGSHMQIKNVAAN